MSALTDRVAAEHTLAWGGAKGHPYRWACTCGFIPYANAPRLTVEHLAHIAAVTEVAVIDAVVARLEAYAAHLDALTITYQAGHMIAGLQVKRLGVLDTIPIVRATGHEYDDDLGPGCVRCGALPGDDETCP